MTDNVPPRQWGRSVASIRAGLAATVGISIGFDLVLRSLGGRPREGIPLSDAMSALGLAYRTIASLLGGYLTARLAPYQPLRHAWVLAAIGTLIATLGLVLTWGRNLGPEWYPIALAVLAIPPVWLGARLERFRDQARAPR